MSRTVSDSSVHVSKIIAHRGSPGSYEFLLEFSNVPTSENKWWPESQVLQLDVYKEYITAISLPGTIHVTLESQLPVPESTLPPPIPRTRRRGRPPRNQSPVASDPPPLPLPIDQPRDPPSSQALIPSRARPRRSNFQYFPMPVPSILEAGSNVIDHSNDELHMTAPLRPP